MIALKDGMLLYHGSFAEVSKIDLGKCRPGKDFGAGFYVTSSYEQAKRFVPLSVKKHMEALGEKDMQIKGYISVYKLCLDEQADFYIFQDADRQWLHYVAANRRSNLFEEMLHDFENYDIIGGKVANDRTARTLQIYISGGYGTPGTQLADDIAISTLLPERLEDQFCFRTQKAVQTLEFIRSDEYVFG